MQRGYCAVSTKYSPALIQASALASPAAFLKARLHLPKRQQVPAACPPCRPWQQPTAAVGWLAAVG